MVVAGLFPIGGVDSALICGPPKALKTIEYFCQNGTRDGIDDSDVENDDESDDGALQPEATDNGVEVTDRIADEMDERCGQVQDDENTGSSRRVCPLGRSSRTGRETLATRSKVLLTNSTRKPGKLKFSLIRRTDVKPLPRVKPPLSLHDMPDPPFPQSLI